MNASRIKEGFLMFNKNGVITGFIFIIDQLACIILNRHASG